MPVFSPEHSYPRRRGDLWVDFTLPAPVLGIDVVRAVLGIDVDRILSPAMRGQRYDHLGQRFWPLVLPAEDEGLMLPIAAWGAFGFKNHKGRLGVLIPPALQTAWESSVSFDVRGKPVDGHVGNAPAKAYLLRLAPGSMVELPLKFVGNVGLRISPDSPHEHP